MLEQRLQKVSFVREDLAEKLLDQARHGITVTHITWREQDIEQFSPIVENQVQFEAEKPASGSLTPFRKTSEDLMQRRRDGLPVSAGKTCRNHRHYRTIRLNYPLGFLLGSLSFDEHKFISFGVPYHELTIIYEHFRIPHAYPESIPSRVGRLESEGHCVRQRGAAYGNATRNIR